MPTLPRFANLAWRGIRNQPMSPYATTPVEEAIYNTAKFARTNPATEYAIANPLPAAAAGLGGIALNHALGNPLGGAVDFLTLDTTNFKPNEEIGYESMPYPSMQPTPSASLSTLVAPAQQPITPLNEEERRKQLEYLQRKMATDMLTIGALQAQRGGQ